MTRILEVALIIMITAASTNCFADYNCNKWVKKDGYCVNYVKSKIPSFPIPTDVASIKKLKNKENNDVARGDVAIFDLGRYWHVAYVEKVHLDQNGNATAVDVSEMNFGGQMSSEDLKNNWGLATKREWKQAVSCGVTKTYGQSSMRENIDLDSIQQIWSPKSSVLQTLGRMLLPMGITL